MNDCLIDELGYDNAKMLIKHPNQKGMNDDRILRKYMVVGVNDLQRRLTEYESKHNIQPKEEN